MYGSTGLPEPHDSRRLPDISSGYDCSARRSALGNFTFSIGHLVLKWKFEIERLEDLGPISPETRTGSRPRNGLRKVFRSRISDNQQVLRPGGLLNTSRQGRAPAFSEGERWMPHQPSSAKSNFWETLDPIEREALGTVGSWATFAVGERLMGEGEPADYVIVIIEGRTRICVDENGWERVLAERGPGQLVGERGGLHVSVRSASVIATEPVTGLVVTTADFCAFVDNHPRVLNIVEDQLYGRLTEDPARHQHYSGSGAFRVVSGGREPTIARPNESLTSTLARPQPLNGENCTVVFTDVVAFSSSARNDEDRRIIREALFGMTQMMLQGSAGARSEDRGDGILTVVPPSIPTANVIERLLKELLPALERHNSAHHESARFQLRAAVNVGPVATDTMGVTGEAIIIAARLVEAPLFKKAMDTTGANLGVIASTFVYETVIKHARNLTGYSQVQVRLKGFNRLAWMKLFGKASPHSDPNPVAA
jgi:class 3 adenylate cyclase